jgi:hypothetical protein
MTMTSSDKRMTNERSVLPPLPPRDHAFQDPEGEQPDIPVWREQSMRAYAMTAIMDHQAEIERLQRELNSKRGSPSFPEAEAAGGGGNSPDVRHAHEPPDVDWPTPDRHHGGTTIEEREAACVREKLYADVYSTWMKEWAGQVSMAALAAEKAQEALDAFDKAIAPEPASRDLTESSFTVYESSPPEDLMRFREMIDVLLNRHAVKSGEQHDE